MSKFVKPTKRHWEIVTICCVERYKPWCRRTFGALLAELHELYPTRAGYKIVKEYDPGTANGKEYPERRAVVWRKKSASKKPRTALEVGGAA